MKATINRPVEVEIRTCLIEAGVRYWEDATVDGVEDSEGDLVPCRRGDLWCPEIDVDSGVIINWEKGKTAEIHYKVCDSGNYHLKDADGNVILSIEEDYVPNGLVPGKYGDYIVMTVDAEGKIKEWPRNPDLSDFTKGHDE